MIEATLSYPHDGPRESDVDPAMISNRERLTNAHLRTPRAAAVAGIAFSVLLFVVFGLIRLSVPADPLESGAWLEGDITCVSLAMNLVPFAGAVFSLVCCQRFPFWVLLVSLSMLRDREPVPGTTASLAP
jgi:hypothetical protein